MPVACVALLGTLAHVFTLQRYGVFRDELYYVACGEHLAWGYVDHPPLVGVLAWIATHVLGGSLVALRVVPIVCYVLTVFVTASLVRRLGGGTWAQFAAVLCVTIAPHYLFIFHVLSMNAPEVLLWTLAARVLVDCLEPGARWRWVLLGLVVGLGALNKHSMLFWVAGLGLGVLLTPARRVLSTRWPWIGAAVAAAMFAPHIAWQFTHGWPLLEFVRNAQQNKISAVSPLSFLTQQVLMMNRLAAPVWIIGLVWCFTRGPGRPPGAARIFAWAWLAVLVLFLVQRSKAYYLTPAYPTLLAAGAVAIAAWTQRRWRWLRVAAPIAWVAAGVTFAPLALPALSPERYVAYRRALGFGPVSSDERHDMGDLPQHFADMHGWEEMARAVSEVYLQLPPEDRAGARFFGQNYGEAGAIAYFARRYELPPAVSGHNTYWMWGPGPPPVGPVIVMGGDREDHTEFRQVDAAGRHDAAHAMPYERDLTIWVCRDLVRPLDEIWPHVRHYN